MSSTAFTPSSAAARGRVAGAPLGEPERGGDRDPERRRLSEREHGEVAPLARGRRGVAEVHRPSPLAPHLARRGIGAHVEQPRPVEKPHARAAPGEGAGQRDVVGPRGARRLVAAGLLEHAPAGQEALAVGEHALGVVAAGYARSIHERGEDGGLQPALGAREAGEAGRERHHVVAALLGGGERAGHEARVGHGIGVHAEHPRGARLREAVLQRPHLADPPRRARRIHEQAQTGVALGGARHEFARAVGGVAVHHEHLGQHVALARQPGKAGGQTARFIIGGHDHGDGARGPLVARLRRRAAAHAGKQTAQHDGRDRGLRNEPGIEGEVHVHESRRRRNLCKKSTTQPERWTVSPGARRISLRHSAYREGGSPSCSSAFCHIVGGRAWGSPPLVCSLSAPVRRPIRRCGPTCWPASCGGTSGPCAPGAWRRSPAPSESRACSTSARRRPACGRPRMRASPGTRSSPTTSKTCRRWAPSRWRPPIRTSSTWAPATSSPAAPSMKGTASTSPPTPARRGPTWGSTPPSRSRRSSSIPRTPIW